MTAAPKRSLAIPITIGLGVVVLLGSGLALLLHARSRVNKVALNASPRLVTTVAAKAVEYRPERRYVGTIEPWISARVGPQYISAYVDTVLVRPGATVKRGEVLATLDCRNPTSMTRAIAEQARAVAASQVAMANEASRVTSLVDGGFASVNEAEMKTAESMKQESQYLALKEQTLGSQLQVNDCVLRAPFNGDVAQRFLDPGAFVHPGDPIVSVVDRSVLRITADVPEEDFDDVAAGTKIHATVLATSGAIDATISRRAPTADGETRTVHFEADVEDPTHTIPTGTTTEIRLAAGKSIKTTEIPLVAAAIKQESAHLFVVSDGVAHAKDVKVIGEQGGSLYVDPSLPAGTQVVTQGRAALADGDKVSTNAEAAL